MPQYEYKVVPAPRKGQKAKGVKTNEARFALAVETVMNDLAARGWEYQRAEMLPSQERAGLASSTTEWRNVMVFRRLRENDADLFEPELLPAPEEMPEETELEEIPSPAAHDPVLRHPGLSPEEPEMDPMEIGRSAPESQGASAPEKVTTEDK